MSIGIIRSLLNRDIKDQGANIFELPYWHVIWESHLRRHHNFERRYTKMRIRVLPWLTWIVTLFAIICPSQAQTFGPQQVINSSSGGVLAVVAADIDGDSDEDVLAGLDRDNKLAWYENLGPFNLTSGLLAFYPFNGNANDESGNGHDGTVEGTVLTQDRFGNANKAYFFDGTTRIVAPNPFSVTGSVLQPFTISVWINSATEKPAAAIISEWQGCGVNPRHFALTLHNRTDLPGDNTRLLAEVIGVGGANIFDREKVVDGQWHHLVFLRSATEVRLYQNTNLEASNGALPPSSRLNIGIPITIGDFRTSSGCGGIDTHFEGLIDDIRIYDRALTEPEIQALFSEGGWTGQSALHLTVDVDPSGPVDWGEQVTFDVTVVDNQGNLVDGATVGGDDFLQGNPFPFSVVTGPDGKVTYTTTVPAGAADGTYDVTFTASKTGFLDSATETRQVEIRHVTETTVITHGYQPDIGTPEWDSYKWPFSMADAISPDRQILFVRHGQVYLADLTRAAFQNIDENQSIDDVVANNFLESFLLDENRSVAIVFDWVEESDRLALGYAEAAADALAATLLDLAATYPWILNRLHFIGHSRGTVVNSEAIERLIFLASTGRIPAAIAANLDAEIHMTTLDPHPAGHWAGSIVSMRDDWVNSNNITFDEDGEDGNGMDRQIGVVGWSSQSYKVAYIDNYYQRSAAFIGLEDYPGSINSLQLDVPVRFGDSDSAHSLVHTWYHGTIDPLATWDEFNETNEGLAISNAWYTEGRTLEGYYYSREREGDLSSIASNDQGLIDVTEDRSYGPDYLIFNGNFFLGTAGWELHGGGGSGRAFFSSSINPYLQLQGGGSSRRHNRLFIPEDAEEIVFGIKTLVPGSNHTLKVLIGDNELSSIDLNRSKGRSTFNEEIIPIMTYQGTTQVLEFRLDGTGPGSAIVWIDNVAFDTNDKMQATLAVNGSSSASKTGSTVFPNLHAYDSFGNHTGPTSDSTWVEEIPGSRFFRSDSLWVITVPAGGGYTFQVESTGYAGSFDFQVDGVKPDGQAPTILFSNIAAGATMKATLSLTNVHGGLHLELDNDGDGTVDDLVEPSAYFEEFSITAEPGENGSISPEAVTVVNYGDEATFTITPDEDYYIDEIFVDGVSIGRVDSYTFTNITADHTISATFVEDTTPPEVTLNGDDPLTLIRFGDPYAESGAIVTDDFDEAPSMLTHSIILP
ncbi:MAG: LamG-like jellyroll fold domain-containing protein [Rhodothermales bacterium]